VYPHRRNAYLVPALALLLAAAGMVGTNVAGASPRSANGGVVTFAEQPGTAPTTIFPMVNGANSGNNNITYLQPLMWLPLYWFGSNTRTSFTVNYRLSIGEPPRYSNGNKTITMTLKKYFWSTGSRVTARDLVFWMNLVLNEKTNVFFYFPGGWMDHVVSYSAPSPTTFVLQLSQAYNPTYLLETVLSTLTPFPQQAWDKTSSTSPVGNDDETAAGAKQVYNFLHGQSQLLSTWDTNPLWQVVDGPWHLKPNTGFETTGQVTLVPNGKYSGPNKPTYSEFEELPFTSASSEYNVLRAGSIDYGYVPTTDVASAGSLKASGFSVKPWYEWGMTWIVVNFTNPKYAPLVSQLYIRQAMELLINQQEYIKRILDGYGLPTYGPVPLSSKSKFLNRTAETNPYPYDPGKAKSLLKMHGWSIAPGRVATCSRAGSGANECGAGIASGSKLEIPLTYATGFPTIAEEAEAFKTSARTAGIELSLKSAPATTASTGAYQCIGETMAKCPANSQELTLYSSPSFTYTPTYFPTGATIFGCGGVTNGGNYCNRHVDSLITLADTEPTPGGLHAFYRFERLIAKQLPVLWFPTRAYQISAISLKLAGVVSQSSTGNIYPSTWHVKS
jgi:peptide/nickel transport system substrate-binding protein